MNRNAREALFDMWECRCFYCNKELDQFAFQIDGRKPPPKMVTVDHLIPKILGGGTRGNIVIACENCNRRKSDSLASKETINRFISHMLNLPDEVRAKRPVYSQLSDLYDDYIAIENILCTMQALTFEHHINTDMALYRII